MSQTPVQPMPSAQRSSERPPDVGQAIAVCVLLVVAVLLVFSRTLSQGFSNFDDNMFVYREPHVSRGFSWTGVAWAFTNGPLGEWYPLSMLSHMLDCQLYGLHPGGHHLTNVLLHAASTVVLFLSLWRMTEALWPCALVAALFAFHPLHVESVAWVAERRDVLSGFFFMLTLGTYGEYVRHPKSRTLYLGMLGFFALGLMSKSMLVTLPPLLLLLDFWPLGRFGHARSDSVAPISRPAPFHPRVLVDKLPLFALAIADAVLTMHTHAAPPSNPLTLSERLANAVVSCVAYLGQLFVPVGLSVFYSHPEAGRPAWQVSAAAVLLLAITAAAVISHRAYPYLFVGWFWYIGMLVPVLGLAYVGAHARADRYTYVSQIGLYIALIWGAMRLGAAWPARRWVLGIGSALMLAALVACAWRQISYWQDDRTLWEHALACDEKNVMARYNLGSELEQNDDGAAVTQYRRALELGPNERIIYRRPRAAAEYGLGNIMARRRDISAAISHYQQALEWESDFLPARTTLARLLSKIGEFDESKVHFDRCLELAPDNADLYCNVAVALAEQGRTDQAIASFEKALELDPDSLTAHRYLATLRSKSGDLNEASDHLLRAIKIDRDAAALYYQMAELLRRQGKMSEATRYQELGEQTARRWAKTKCLRGDELAQQGKLAEAIAQFQLAIGAAPDYAQAHSDLADALASQGRLEEAVTCYRRALEIDPNFAPAKRGLQRLK